jgi:hypothetical protein
VHSIQNDLTHIKGSEVGHARKNPFHRFETTPRSKEHESKIADQEAFTGPAWSPSSEPMPATNHRVGRARLEKL